MNKETLHALLRKEEFAEKWLEEGTGSVYKCEKDLEEVYGTVDRRPWYVIHVISGYENGDYIDHHSDESLYEEFGPYSEKEIFEILHEEFDVPTDFRLLDLKAFEWRLEDQDCDDDYGSYGRTWSLLKVVPIVHKPKSQWRKYLVDNKIEQAKQRLESAEHRISYLNEIINRKADRGKELDWWRKERACELEEEKTKQAKLQLELTELAKQKEEAT